MERTDLEQWKSREVARLLTLIETQRRYYQDIVASIPVGLLVLSSDVAIVLANAAARKTLGLRGGDSLQRRLDTLLPAWLLDRVEEVLKTGVPQTGILLELEQGGKRRLRVSILPIRGWDNEAAPEALLSIEDLSDVLTAPLATEASAAEPATPESPDLQPAQAPAPPLAPSELLEHVNAVVWAVEIPTMRFVYVSPQAEQLLGFPLEHWTAGHSFWTDRVYSEDRDVVTQSYRRAIETRQAHSCEFRALAADGRTVWSRESARLVPDSEGRPQYLIGITIDVSERRLLEDQLVQSERVEAVSKLASRMAHDLNNMLMILTGYGEELLSNIPVGSPLRPDIQEILAATERMSGLTTQLLAFARRQVAVTGSLDLEPMLESLSRRLGARLGAGIALELKLSAEPNRVPANAAQLEQVVSEIVDRARQVISSQGKITIETSSFDIAEDMRRDNTPLKPGVYAAIAITVPGLAPRGDRKASLFECSVPGKEPWDESAAELSRAYGIVRQWGGDIAVIDGPNETCIFRIFLPRLETPAGAAEMAAPEPQAAPKVEHRATILVVEDEAGIRALVRKILLRQNYEVLEAASGEEALIICRENPTEIDLLITDMIMPQMGGRELADRLREEGRVMKVLFVSGYTDDATVYSGQLPPGTAFLQKPFTLGSLLDKVKEVLAEQAS
jgi:two-component system cell cycle sensor histidine kinase/response regulator CckA